MALVTRYVNTASTAGGDGTTNGTAGATRAYASLNEWESNEQTNLVSAGDTHTVICTGSTADSTQTILDGWTTGASNGITVQGDTLTSTVLDTAKYRLARAGNILYLRDQYIKLLNVQFLLTSSGSGGQETIQIDPTGSTGLIEVDKCILQGNITNNNTVYGLACYKGLAIRVTNSIIHHYARTSSLNYGIIANSSATDTEIYNCTIADNRIGIKVDATVTVKNCAVFNNTDDFSGTFNVIDYCASDDGDGTNSVSPSDWTTVFTDYANDDYTLKSTDTELIDAGVDLSGTFTDDFFGDTRGATWDIGADEYISAGTNVNATVDALTLTEQSATVNAEINVSTNVHALTLTEQQVTVSLGVDVSAGVDVLTLTEQQAVVNAETNVNTTVDVLTLTEFAANITVPSGGTDVNANTDVLTLTGLQAVILTDTNVNVSVHALGITTQGATITSGTPITTYHLLVGNQMIAQLTDTAFPLTMAVDNSGGVTGLAITVALRDPANSSSFLDFADSTFKTSGWTTKFQALADYGSGFYGVNLDVSSITNFPGANHATLEYAVTGTVVAVSQGTLSIAQTWEQAKALTVGKYIGLS